MQIAGKNIISCLTEHAHTSPQKTVFVFLENGESIESQISYTELELKVKTLAAALNGRQLAYKRVLLVYKDIPDFIVSFLACQYAGIIPVPVPYMKGTKQIMRLKNIADDAKIAAILCAVHSVKELGERLGEIIASTQCELIATDINDPVSASLTLYEPVKSNIAFIQYTSGSTGMPKGVIISADNLMHNQVLLENTFNCTYDSVILSWLPFHHDMGLIGNILHTIYTGCTCVLMSPLDFMQRPQRWVEAISRFRATHSGGPNFAYDWCVEKIPADELTKLDLSSWVVAYNGSEPVRKETLERFREHFKTARFSPNAFAPCYGLAEATLLVSAHRNESEPTTIFINKDVADSSKIRLSDSDNTNTRCLVSSGRIAEGMLLRIISEKDQHECADLEEGEICIAGESVTNGYWGKNNASVFYEHNNRLFLRTGDLGFVYNGELFVHGRLKEMIIIRGSNFYPYDIEELISGTNAVIENNGVAVFSTDIEPDKFVIVAEVKRSFIKDLKPVEIIDSINRTVIASFGITPYDIVLTTPLGIPRTTSGKLQRIQCRDIYARNAFSRIAAKLALEGEQVRKERDTQYLQAVRDHGGYEDIKKYLSEMIEWKLCSSEAMPVNEHSELIEMGIDSIRIMELVNLINKELDINLDASKIFQPNTLASLSRNLENMLWLKNKKTFGSEITI
jgi:acyl-CoA synthetase (AMP-forming)/AMP-acid ligase II/acyl carrier protein